MSVFFIVVILLGVFFAMGYIVGRGANPVAGPEVAARRPESKPLVETPPPQHELLRPKRPREPRLRMVRRSHLPHSRQRGLRP